MPKSEGLRTVRVSLFGFGNVGRGFVELVAEKDGELARDFDLRLLFTAVGTRGHGSLLAPRGRDATAVLAAWRSGRFDDAERAADELLGASGADVLVEATTLEARGGGVAARHIEAAFATGMDVVTVNKGPIAWEYRRLADRARVSGRRLRCEGTVLDGTPVFNLCDATLRGCRVLGFDGVLNSTTNYVLDAMGEGGGFAAALAHAQEQGFAEADPAHDVDGHDAAAKTAALANVLMDARITPDQVARESIAGVTPERVRHAWEAGRRLRVVCTVLPADLARVAELPVSGAGPSGGTGGAAAPEGAAAPPVPIRASVKVLELPPEHPFFSVGGSSAALILHTDLMGDVEIVEREGLPAQTAYAVYSDLLDLYGRR